MLWIIGVALAAEWKLTNPAVARYNKGVEAYNTEEFKAAATHFAAAADACGGCGDALLMQARALYADARPAEALPVVETVLAAWPTEPGALHLGSEVYFVQQRFSDARRLAEQAVALDPQDRIAVNLLINAIVRIGDYDAGEALVTGSAAIDAASKTCYRAQFAVERKDADLATQLSLLCEQSSDTNLVALTRTRVGVLIGARATVTDAAMLAGLTEIIDALALTELMQRGECPEAIRMGKRRIAENPNDVVAIEAVAYCQVRMGELEAGLRTLRTLFDAKEWIAVGSGHMVTGIVTASAARAFNDRVATGLGTLATALQDAHRTAEAEDVLNRAEARLGRSATVIAARARLRMAQGDPAGAWAAVAEALVLEPDNMSVMQLAGTVAFKDPHGVPESVARVLATRGPPDARLNYAAGLSNAGDWAACLEVLGPELDIGGAPSLGMKCATGARNRAAYERWSRAGTAAKEATITLVAAEAWHRCEEGQAKEGIDLVADLVGETAEERSLLAQVRLRAMGDLNRLDEAVTIARLGEAPPTSIYNVGIDLANARRYSEAREILLIACPRMPPENRKSCEDTAASLP